MPFPAFPHWLPEFPVPLFPPGGLFPAGRLQFEVQVDCEAVPKPCLHVYVFVSHPQVLLLFEGGGFLGGGLPDLQLA